MGVVVPAGDGKYSVAVKRFFLFPYRTVRYENGDPVKFRFRQSAIEYLQGHCRVDIKDIKVM